MENQLTLPQIPAEKILLSRNEGAVRTFEKEMAELQVAAQAAFLSFREIGVGDISIAELEQLVKKQTSADELVRTRVAGNTPVSVGGLNLSIEKLRDMVEIPDIRPFEQVLGQLQHIMRPNVNANKHKSTVNYFEIAGDEVVLKAGVLERFTDQNSVYAEKEGEKECILIAKQIKDLLDYAAGKYNFHMLKGAGVFTQSISGDDRININTQAIKNGLNDFYRHNR